MITYYQNKLFFSWFYSAASSVVSSSVAASFADSPSIFRGLSELRVKESDRLELINLNLKKCGVNCEIINDDLYIYPSLNYKVNNNFIRTDFDHRIAMAFSVMGSKIGKISIDDSDSIKTSFPTFVDEFNKIISW